MKLDVTQAKICRLALEAVPVQGKAQLALVLALMESLEEFIHGDVSTGPEPGPDSAE